VLLDADRLPEAEDACRVSEAAGAADDIFTQIELRSARARIAARRGELAEAEYLARQACDEADATDYMQLHTRSRLALADVLRLAGRKKEAVTYVEEAASAEERRGNVPYAATIRRRPAAWSAS
jgi:ATP/maltotriose-dependent transcriptional regulator MalT